MSATGLRPRSSRSPRTRLPGWQVETAYERNWSALENGALLTEAESAGCAVFLTTDKNLKYQQRLAERRIAVIVLSTTSWPRIEQHVSQILEALGRAQAGSFIEIEIP